MESYFHSPEKIRLQLDKAFLKFVADRIIEKLSTSTENVLLISLRLCGLRHAISHKNKHNLLTVALGRLWKTRASHGRMAL